MRVAIIPTGRMEWSGMSAALTSVFPGAPVEFYVLPTAAEVETMAKSDEFPASSFTSCDVTRIVDRPGNNAQKLVARAAAVVDDSEYDLDEAQGCEAWRAMPAGTRSQRKRKKNNRPAWAERGDGKVRHPKAYLSWLCRDPASPKCSAYNETSGGAQALAQLEWPRLMALPDGARFARALLEDIAECIGVAHPFPGEVAPSTARSVLPRDPLLRNL